MAFEILPFALAFVSGLFVKAVDWLEDTVKSKSPVRYLFAIIYGLLIGYIISSASFSAIFLAALLAQVFARKIDTRAHELGFIVAILSALLLGLPPLDLPILAFFLVLGFLDEVDYVGKLRPLTDYRPFLKVGSLLLIAIGRWDYFAGIIIFDIAYEGISIVLPRAEGKKQASRAKTR